MQDGAWKVGLEGLQGKREVFMNKEAPLSSDEIGKADSTITNGS